MANILLVDSGETARSAMRGMLERGNHRFAAVETEPAAWAFIAEHLRIDLVIMDLRFSDGTGIGLLRRLRADPQFMGLPVLVYTTNASRNDVKTCLEAKVQNFLMKPYDEEVVFQEVEKAVANPWREALFEEERSFCQMMNYRVTDLHKMLRDVGRQCEAVVPKLRHWVEAAAEYSGEQGLELPAEVLELKDAAEAAGAWGVVETLSAVQDCAKRGHEAKCPAVFESLVRAARFIDLRLEPDLPCLGFMDEREVGAHEEEKARAVWLNAPEEGRCPMSTWEDLQRRIEGMKGCPVIDSAAAAFKMTATGHPSCINPLMDLVARDPGLSAQMLISVNQSHPVDDERSRIEDARSAVSQLGEMKLAALSGSLVTLDQSTLTVPPNFSWPQYWIFVRAVARVAQHICEQLELYSLEPAARTAGELHDIGKLVLAHLEPIGFQVILEHTRRRRMALAETEKLFLDATSAQMGAHFAERFGLSVRFTNVIRWMAAPESAGEDARLAAVVSLARDFCERAGVGSSGNYVDPEAPFMADQCAAWTVLQDCVFPSFNLREFEQGIFILCRALKSELAGRGGTTAPLQVA